MQPRAGRPQRFPMIDGRRLDAPVPDVTSGEYNLHRVGLASSGLGEMGLGRRTVDGRPRTEDRGRWTADHDTHGVTDHCSPITFGVLQQRAVGDWLLVIGDWRSGFGYLARRPPSIVDRLVSVVRLPLAHCECRM